MFRPIPFDDQTKVEILPGVWSINDEALEAEVLRLWYQAQSKRQKPLTDGRIFSLTHVEPGLLQGCFIPYRYFVAQLESAQLFPRLQVQTMAVSGLLRCRDEVVWGRRHGDTVFGGGMLELVPSGGLSRQAEREGAIDVAQQLVLELQEEIGIPADIIPQPKPYCCVEDTDLHVWDVGMEISLPWTGQKLLKHYQEHGSWEYSSLQLVAEERLLSFMADHDKEILPVSKEMVRHWLHNR